VFINPPWELAEQIAQHFEDCRRTSPISTMAVFVLPKWAKFTQVTKHWKLYQEFPASTQLFTRQSLENPAQQEVVAPAPWPVQLWLVDADCAFCDSTASTSPDQPTSVHVPPDDSEHSIATLQQFSSPATALLTDLTEARPLIRTELTVKTPDGGHQISGLVDCAATLDFVSEDFVRRFALQTRKSTIKTPVRLANGQRVTSTTICDVTFEQARHEFHRTFYVLRDLRTADLILGLPWLDDEHASLQFGTTKVFTLMDGTAVETTLEERRPECLLLSSTKVQKLLRKTRRSKGRHAEFYVIELTSAAEQRTDFHIGEELTAEQRDNFRSLLFDDFPELLQPLDSPHVSR
jgi:hypothetical protein